VSKNAQNAVLREIVLAFEPLVSADSAYRVTVLFRELGYELPGGNSFPGLPGLAAHMESTIQALIKFDEADDNNKIDALAKLGDQIVQLTQEIIALKAVVNSATAAFPAFASNALLDQLPVRLMDYLIFEYTRVHRQPVWAIMRLVGVFEMMNLPADGGIFQPATSLRTIHWEHLTKLIYDPVSLFDEIYSWNTAFDSNKFFTNIEGVLRAFLLPGGLYVQTQNLQAALGNTAPDLKELRFPILQNAIFPSTYAQFGLNVTSVEAKGSKKPGFAIVPYIFGATDFDFDLNETFEAVFKSTASVDAGLGIIIRPDMIEFMTNLFSSPQEVATFDAQFSLQPRMHGGEIILFGETGTTRLAIEGPSIKAFALNQENGMDVGLEFKLEAIRLIVTGKEGDNFLKTLLGDREINAEASFGIGLSARQGVYFVGSGELELRSDIHLSLGPLRIQGIIIALKIENDHFVLEAGLIIETELGPVVTIVENLGLKTIISFPDGGGNLGPVDLDIGFKPPNGIGLSVDASVVIGGGFLRFDTDKGEYSGVLELVIVDKLTVKALGLLTTRMPDGSKGYSLLIIITAEDFEPIQLPLAFKLTGIGGLIAVNRTFDEEVLRAGLKTHILDSVLFPKDLIRNAPQILSNLSKVFPPADGHYLFGPVVQIGWGTPTLITANVALVLELGARLRLLILAQVLAVLPDPETEQIRLQMDAIGVIDFDQGTASLDATLHDSRLLKKFVLTGDMAMRLRWESPRNFALAVGGLHPAFNPPPNFPKLERISINLASGDNPRIRCEAYFALTANTVQFGAHAELYASAAGFSIQGEFGYDVLIQFSPFQFLAEFYAQLQLKRGSTNLFKVRFEGALSGPRPLHIKGKATFEILWWDYSIRVDKTLVSGEKPPLPQPIDVLAQLKDELNKPNNWTGQLPTRQRSMVTFRRVAMEADAVLLHPLGTLSVKQTIVPLDMEISKFGQTVPSGARRFTIDNVRLGGQLDQKPNPVRDFFAPAQFFEMSDDEKLSRPSFEQMNAGITMGSDQFTFGAGFEAKSIEFETYLVDKEHADPRHINPEQPYQLPAEQLSRQARFGAAGASDLRRSGRGRYQTIVGKHKVAKEGWSIVAANDLTLSAGFGRPDGKAMSYSEAAQALSELKQQNPRQAANLKILRFQSEVNTIK
jgi:hypothetical protein